MRQARGPVAAGGRGLGQRGGDLRRLGHRQIAPDPGPADGASRRRKGDAALPMLAAADQYSARAHDRARSPSGGSGGRRQPAGNGGQAPRSPCGRNRRHAHAHPLLRRAALDPVLRRLYAGGPALAEGARARAAGDRRRGGEPLAAAAGPDHRRGRAVDRPDQRRSSRAPVGQGGPRAPLADLQPPRPGRPLLAGGAQGPAGAARQARAQGMREDGAGHRRRR